MKAVFLDRDGVINENRPDYVTDEAAFKFLPGALDALALLAASQFKVVVVTNQSAVGRGRLSVEGLDAIHTHMVAAVESAGGRIDRIYICPHHPDSKCTCRKPGTELLQRAACDLDIDLCSSYFVGDAASDIQAGQDVGCQSVLVLTGRGRSASMELARRGLGSCWIALNLLQAVRLVLEAEATSAVDTRVEAVTETAGGRSCAPRQVQVARAAANRISPGIGYTPWFAGLPEPLEAWGTRS